MFVYVHWNVVGSNKQVSPVGQLYSCLGSWAVVGVERGEFDCNLLHS